MTGETASASAPGKVILFGEHAVVYGYPAIAAPVMQLEASARIRKINEGVTSFDVRIDAPDIGLHDSLLSLPPDDPLSLAIRGTMAVLKIKNPPAINLEITSTIPVASGLGSGAAVSIAIIRALAQYFRKNLPAEIVSGLAYEVEKRHHGRPSGIDNTVIAYAQPIFFQREKPFEILTPIQPFTLVIADTGIASPTALAVAGVKERRDLEPLRFQAIFDEIGAISIRARDLFINGPVGEIGALMTRNHALLQQIGVSGKELDRLVETALKAGASGAKLSGGGLGGNMIAMVEYPESVEKVSKALLENGAARCFSTTVGFSGSEKAT